MNQPSGASNGEEVLKNRKLKLMRNTNQEGISKPLTRLKSTHQQQKIETTTKLPMKPRSSMGKRPASSRKLTQTVNSVATTSSARSEQEVKQIIGTVFNHSKKLQNFIEDKKMDQQQAYSMLVNNQLFTLSLVNMVANKSGEEASKYVQRSCIHKLDRIMAMEKQKLICDSIQNKIEALIDKRIKSLSQFA